MLHRPLALERSDGAAGGHRYRNHDTYVSRVTQVTQGNMKRGFVMQEDAEATIREAAQSPIGKR